MEWKHVSVTMKHLHMHFLDAFILLLFAPKAKLTRALFCKREWIRLRTKYLSVHISLALIFSLLFCLEWARRGSTLSQVLTAISAVCSTTACTLCLCSLCVGHFVPLFLFSHLYCNTFYSVDPLFHSLISVTWTLTHFSTVRFFTFTTFRNWTTLSEVSIHFAIDCVL